MNNDCELVIARRRKLVIHGARFFYHAELETSARGSDYNFFNNLRGNVALCLGTTVEMGNQLMDSVS